MENNVKKGKGRRGGNNAQYILINSNKNKSKLRPQNISHKNLRGKHSYKKFTKKELPLRDCIPESLLWHSYDVIVERINKYGAFIKAPDKLLTFYNNNGENQSKKSLGQSILLPFSEQTEKLNEGMLVKVHFYEDKSGRMACTMRKPILEDGKLGILKVADVTKIGSFLDNGMPKQVLLPFREQIVAVNKGDNVLVWLYTDKSGRPAASMRVYSHLLSNSPYKENSIVKGFVYEINPKLGIFVAVDNKYFGMLPISETFMNFHYGEIISARVVRVRTDGKLDLAIREKLYESTDKDARKILDELKNNNGFLPYGDRSSPDFIEEKYQMSKNQFKRALGHLYKNHLVLLDRVNDTVSLL